MNGIPRSRRASRPVRVSLAPEPGIGIGGAWWPHSSAIAAELPDLIGALHRSIGEVETIKINWSATEGQMDLETIAARSRVLLPGADHRRPRLMSIVGKEAGVNLLVIPSMTSQALGSMVLRTAAGLPATVDATSGRLYQVACAVIDLACTESARWSEPAG